MCSVSHLITSPFSISLFFLIITLYTYSSFFFPDILYDTTTQKTRRGKEGEHWPLLGNLAPFSFTHDVLHAFTVSRKRQRGSVPKDAKC